MTAPEGSGWGDGVVWSDLDEATADAAIAEHGRLTSAGWGAASSGSTTATTGRPTCRTRLRAAGLRAGRRGDARRRAGRRGARAAGRCPGAEGVTLRHLRDDPDGRAADWAAIRDLHERVWDEDASGLIREVSAEQAADPAAMSVHLALADDGTSGLCGVDPVPRRHRLRLAVGRQHAAGVPPSRASTARWWLGGRARRPTAASATCRSTPPATAGRSSSDWGCTG